MDFALTDDHLALRDAVQRYCDDAYPAPERGAPEDAALAARRHAGLAALGLLGLPFDAAHGGSEQGPVEAMLVAQEFGRVLGGGTWLANSVLAGPLLAAAGTPGQRARWLPPLVRGECQLALACHEPEARHELADVQTRARREGSHWRLDGRKSLVLGGDRAQWLLVVARTAGGRHDPDGLTLFAVPAGQAGLQTRPFLTLDARGAAHLVLDGVLVEVDQQIGPLGGAHPLLEAAMARGNAALCAEAAGALEALLGLCVEHLRTRRQFGAPLAKFQALQHAVADMAIALEQIKSMACLAAMALQGEDGAERDRLVSAAMALSAQLGRRHGLAAIQLHGAMGMTDECRVGHYAKRLIAIGQLFGDAAGHLQRFDRLRAAAAAVTAGAGTAATA